MLQKIIASYQLPSEKLSEYINKYWTAHNPTDEYIEVPIVPDGCIDIIFKNGQVFLSGLMKTTQVITIHPDDSYFGIQFKPYAVALLFNEDISYFNDMFKPLDEIDVSLTNALSSVMQYNEEPHSKLNEYFERYFATHKVDSLLLAAIEGIKSSDGNIGISDLCETLNIHQKKLERVFVTQVGVSPKQFAKIVRFNKTHRVLAEEGTDNLTQKVLDKGYFDQAHFNRDFKKFTGVNPSSKLMSILYNT